MWTVIKIQDKEIVKFKNTGREINEIVEILSDYFNNSEEKNLQLASSETVLGLGNLLA